MRGDGIIPESVKKVEQDVTITVKDTGVMTPDKSAFIGKCCAIQHDTFPSKTVSEILASCEEEWKQLFPEQPREPEQRKPEYPQKPMPDDEPGSTGDRGEQLRSSRHIYSFDCNDGAVVISKDVFNLDATSSDNKFNAIAVIGDRFYKNKFLSYEELSKSYHGMDGAFHDIDHHGTTWIDGHPSIEYIIGYQDNTMVDPVSKRMTTDIHIDHDAPKYQAWENYMRTCRKAGRTPNVSVSFWASSKDMKARDLPVNYGAYGYDDDDIVECLYDINFVALSTVMQGACDDKMGCGIGVHMSEEEQKIINEIKTNNLELFRRIKNFKEE